MRNRDRFEEQLAAVAARMDSAARQMQDVDLSEELLLDYYAGNLPEEQARRVGRLAALSPAATAYLARLQLDAEEASARTDRRTGWARIRSAVPKVAVVRGFATSMGPVRSWSVATGVLAAAITAVLVLPPMLSSPPDFGGRTFLVASGQSKSVETLPGGDRIGDVVTQWPLHVPAGNVPSVKWFVWDAVSGATHYSLQVIASSGRIVFATVTEDPHAKIPRSAVAQLPRGAECAWVVDALDAQDQVLARGVARFTLGD